MENRAELSAAKAVETLSKYPDRFNTRETLQDLVRGMSVDTPGNVTMLYSGMVNADVSSNKLALAVARQDKDVRVIDKTEAAKLLSSDEFINAVATAHGTTPKKVREDYTDPGNKFLFDGKDGLWAATSERFVKDTKTEVVTATPYARGDRVFAQVELREALNNKDIPSINGIPKDVFKEIYKTTGSLEEVNKAVAASSFDRMQGMQAAVINARVTAVDTAAFIDRPSPALSADQRANLKPVLDPAKEAEFADGRHLLKDVRLKLKSEEHKHESNGALAKDALHAPVPTIAQGRNADSRHLTADTGADQATALAQARVQAFTQKPPGEGTKEHPELAGAYAAAAAMEKRVQADGLTPEQKAYVSARIRENIAKSIERGELPQVQVREQREVIREAQPERQPSR
jgi:hypothetical protein